MKKHSVFPGMLAVLSLTLASGVLAQQSALPEQSKSASQSSQNYPSASDHKPDALTAVQGVLLSTETLLGSNVKNPLGTRRGGLEATHACSAHRTCDVRGGGYGRLSRDG